MRKLDVMIKRFLSTGFILSLLGMVMIIQLIVMAGFFWEREHKVTPAFYAQISSAIAPALSFADSLPNSERRAVWRRIARFIKVIPANKVQILDNKTPLFSHSHVAEMIEEHLEDDAPEVEIDAVWVLTNHIPYKPRHKNHMDEHEEDLKPYPALLVTLTDGNRYLLLGHSSLKVLDDIPLFMLLLVLFLTTLPLALAWLIIWHLRRSIQKFGQAAKAFGQNISAQPLAMNGANDVLEASKAFNYMQKRICALVDERSRIVAAISHDLKTQLTKLRLRTDFIPDNNQREKAVLDIERLDKLLSQVMQFARAQENKLELNIEPLELSKLIKDMARDMNWSKKLELSELKDQTLESDRGHIERILMNLIQNALRYGENAKIWNEKKEGLATLYIHDQGPGIPEDQLEQVFEPFYRLESSRNLKTGGSGLGLAICQGLARQLGIILNLKNHSNGGLLVTLDFPLGSSSLKDKL